MMAIRKNRQLGCDVITISLEQSEEAVFGVGSIQWLDPVNRESYKHL
jgi:hypothetical protein